MVRIILFGMPGAGKGTQGLKIEEEFGYKRISTGDMIRQKIAAGGRKGRKMKNVVEKGRLISDDTVIKLVKDRLSRKDIHGGYQLDGVPRNLYQAREISRIPVNREIVIHLRLNEETAVSRLLNRRFCPACSRSFTAGEAEEMNHQCPCGGSLTVREDDARDTIRNRIETYHRETRPLTDFYRERENLVDIDAGRDKGTVFSDISEHLCHDH